MISNSAAAHAKVAIYIRVSTLHQIDRDSLPMQRQDLIAYAKLILNTDDVAFGGNGLTDDSVVHFTITDPLYKKEKKEWLKLYIPARTAVVLRKKK